LAEQAEKYPSFNQMAQQDGLLKSHKRKNVSIMRRIITNLDLWTLAERLSDALMQVSIKFLRYVCKFVTHLLVV